MAPNLYIVVHDLFHPRTWLSRTRPRSTHSDHPLARTEHWNSPVAGVYRHKPGVGWFLIQLDADPSQPAAPDRVVFCAALNRGILESDYEVRSLWAPLPHGCTPSPSRPVSPGRPRGSIGKATPPSTRHNSVVDGSVETAAVHFVRCDDGVAWVNDKDARGVPTVGPWQRFCIDKATGEMRRMLRGDDPNHGKQQPSRHGSWSDATTLRVDGSRPASLRSADGKVVAEGIRAIAPELDGKTMTTTPSFQGPRSLRGSAKVSPRDTPQASRPASIRVSSGKSAAKSPLSSPLLN